MDVSAVAPFTRVGCPACGEETRVKTQFGNYRLERRLAIGGMSVVFVARDTVLDREVAVKILNEDYSSDERRISAFEEEARVTASLSHPNIVRVLTTGRAFGRFFIAMELVPGGHFERYIREQGKVSEARMLPLAIQIANGLKAAHAANLIHRDVKPGNILLDGEGNAKLVDFGLALVTHGGMARANELWATPYYVPPETVEGAPEDFRADVYAFGATLYHALAGRPSCGEERMATDILRAAKKNIVPLHQAEPALSMAVCEIVDKAMAYEPSQRYSSYDELLHDLEDAAKHVKLGIARETAGDVANRRAKRKLQERLAIAGSAVVVAIAALGGLAWILRDDAGDDVVDVPPASAPRANDGGGGGDDDLALRPIDVAGRYDEARAALRAAAFDEAIEAFVRLRDNPEIAEPTRSWAGVEAVLAAYLGGAPERARQLGADARRHIRDAGHEDPEISRLALPVLRQLGELEALKPDVPPGGATVDGPQLIAWMLAALKNWEHGMLVAAEPLLRAIDAAELPPHAQWASFYQEIARDHLHDLELLTDPVFTTTPADAAAADAAIRTLDRRIDELRTHGRARFNIRAWQLDLARHRLAHGGSAPALPQPPVADAGSPVPDDPPDVDAGIDYPWIGPVAALAAEFRFSEAAVLLRSVETSEETSAAQLAWLTLTEAANVFLGDLEEDLVKSSGAVIPRLELKSGDEARDVRFDGRGALVDGDARMIRWADVSPGALIDLHRDRVRQTASGIEALRRHECAIAFDWLAGDRARAMAAAARLADQHPAFRTRWDAILPHLPR
jgi:tRNA A-37 threonylcarbamoyl transferase component Bud32